MHWRTSSRSASVREPTSPFRIRPAAEASSAASGPFSVRGRSGICRLRKGGNLLAHHRRQQRAHIVPIDFEARRQHVAGLSRPSLPRLRADGRSEEHTSELQSLMRISYAVFCLKKKNKIKQKKQTISYRTKKTI